MDAAGEGEDEDSEGAIGVGVMGMLVLVGVGGVDAETLRRRQWATLKSQRAYCKSLPARGMLSPCPAKTEARFDSSARNHPLCVALVRPRVFSGHSFSYRQATLKSEVMSVLLSVKAFSFKAHRIRGEVQPYLEVCLRNILAEHYASFKNMAKKFPGWCSKILDV